MDVRKKERKWKTITMKNRVDGKRKKREKKKKMSGRTGKKSEVIWWKKKKINEKKLGRKNKKEGSGRNKLKCSNMERETDRKRERGRLGGSLRTRKMRKRKENER